MTFKFDLSQPDLDRINEPAAREFSNEPRNLGDMKKMVDQFLFYEMGLSKESDETIVTFLRSSQGRLLYGGSRTPLELVSDRYPNPQVIKMYAIPNGDEAQILEKFNGFGFTTPISILGREMYAQEKLDFKKYRSLHSIAFGVMDSGFDLDEQSKRIKKVIKTGGFFRGQMLKLGVIDVHSHWLDEYFVKEFSYEGTNRFDMKVVDLGAAVIDLSLSNASPFRNAEFTQFVHFLRNGDSSTIIHRLFDNVGIGVSEIAGLVAKLREQYDDEDVARIVYSLYIGLIGINTYFRLIVNDFGFIQSWSSICIRDHIEGFLDGLNAPLE